MKKTFFIPAAALLATNLIFGQTMSTPINVSKSPDNNSKWAQCAMGPNGEVHIVWVEEYPGLSGNDIYYVKNDVFRRLRLYKSTAETPIWNHGGFDCWAGKPDGGFRSPIM